MSGLRLIRLARVALPLLALAGCAELDPMTRPGEWKATGANDANLRAMIAVPSDLVYGVGTVTSDGNRAARAMDRLRNDKVYPLPQNAISSVGQTGSSAAPPSGGTE